MEIINILIDFLIIIDRIKVVKVGVFDICIVDYRLIYRVLKLFKIRVLLVIRLVIDWKIVIKIFLDIK